MKTNVEYHFTIDDVLPSLLLLLDSLENKTMLHIPSYYDELFTHLNTNISTDTFSSSLHHTL